MRSTFKSCEGYQSVISAYTNLKDISELYKDNRDGVARLWEPDDQEQIGEPTKHWTAWKSKQVLRLKLTCKIFASTFEGDLLLPP